MLHTSKGLPGFFVADKPAAISAAINALRGTEAEFLNELLRPALAGDMKVIWLLPGARVPQRLLDHTNEPTAIVLGGDPGSGRPTPPPEAFPQARRLLAWSAATIVHATGGQPEHYRAAAEAARLVRRILLIETATDQESAWVVMTRTESERRGSSCKGFPTLVISARPRGGVHPVQGSAR